MTFEMPDIAQEIERAMSLHVVFIAYCVITRDRDGVYTNDNYSDFLNEFAGYVSELTFIGGAATSANAEYFNVDGTSRYRRPITHPNVRVQTAGVVSSSLSMWQTLKATLVKLKVMMRAIKGADIVYITIPSFMGLIIAFLCWLRRKPFGFYVGADLIEVMDHFSRTGELKHGFVSIRRWLSISGDRFLARRARFIIVAGEQSYVKYRSLNSNTYAVKPMVNVTPQAFDFKRPAQPMLCCQVIFVGALVPRKNVDQLLRAIGELDEAAPGSVFCRIVGHGKPDYIDMLTDLVRELKLEKIVRFYGRVTDNVILQDLYRASDILVLPSSAEGFPRVLYEAMSKGCLIIASGISSITAMLIPDSDFLAIEPEKHGSIAAAIRRLSSDTALALSMRNRNESFVRARITNATAAEQLASVLSSANLHSRQNTIHV